MKKFKVVDLKEYYEVLGYADTMVEVEQLAEEQIEATDGDCAVYYIPKNVDDKYNLIDRIFVESV